MLQAIEMRQRYIKSSNQVFSPTADRHVRLARGKTKSPKPEEMVSFYAYAYLWLLKLPLTAWLFRTYLFSRYIQT